MSKPSPFVRAMIASASREYFERTYPKPLPAPKQAPKGLSLAEGAEFLRAAYLAVYPRRTPGPR